jgi:anti-anti-sigma regulatory factor
VTAIVSRDQDQPRIDQQRVEGAMLVRPIGGLDSDLVAEVRQTVLQARSPVVIDLTGSVLVDPVALQRIAKDWDLYRPRMCVVCERPSGRELLTRAGIDEDLAVFDDVDEALQALTSTGAGADGWTPSARRG